MNDFSVKEGDCRRVFADSGRFWHAYTNGKEMPVIFRGREDYELAMNVIAQAAYGEPRVRVLTFVVMSNHFHFVVSTTGTTGVSDGARSEIFDLFSVIKKRLIRGGLEMRGVELSVKPIETLQSLRNTIVYVNRNGYVADPNHTPFSYPWGAGRYYFNPIPLSVRFGDLSYKDKRVLFRCSSPELPEDWKIIEGHVAPPSYCALDLGKSLFLGGRQYFSMLSRNVESYAEVAVDIDDGEFLTDTELYEQVRAIVERDYRRSSVKELPKSQKLDLARSLRREFHSSNGQISRVIGVPVFEINALFPLRAR